eukprot:gene7021-3313_t
MPAAAAAPVPERKGAPGGGGAVGIIVGAVVLGPPALGRAAGCR